MKATPSLLHVEKFEDKKLEGKITKTTKVAEQLIMWIGVDFSSSFGEREKKQG